MGRERWVSSHSDPFSLWVLKTDAPDDVKRRIAQKLKLPLETVAAWKPAVTVNKEIVDIDAGASVWDQMQKAHADITKVVFALEHTPLPGTRANTNWRREEGV